MGIPSLNNHIHVGREIKPCLESHQLRTINRKSCSLQRRSCSSSPDSFKDSKMMVPTSPAHCTDCHISATHSEVSLEMKVAHNFIIFIL